MLKKKKDSSKIPFISYWSNGDIYKFKVKKFKEKWKDYKSIRNDSIVITLFFTILDSSSTSYKISWK